MLAELRACSATRGLTIGSFCPLQALEKLLCRTLGCDTFTAYLARLTGDVPCPCTNVWQAGAIAYRCLDCQTVPHSAVCVECFQVGRVFAAKRPCAWPESRRIALMPAA